MNRVITCKTARSPVPSAMKSTLR